MINQQEAIRLLSKTRQVKQYLDQASSRSNVMAPTMSVLYAQEEIEMFFQRLISHDILGFQDGT